MWFLNLAVRKIEAMRLDLKCAGRFRSRWALTRRTGASISTLGSGHRFVSTNVKTSVGEGASLLTIKQVAESLGVCTRTIWREISQRRFPAPLPIRGAARWPASDVAEYIERLKRERGSLPFAS